MREGLPVPDVVGQLIELLPYSYFQLGAIQLQDA